MRFSRARPHPLAELVEREEVVYGLCLREATRLPWGPPAAALRALVAHANESLDDLRRLARARRIRTGSARAVALDALGRLVDRLTGRLPIARESSVARMLAAVRASLEGARALRVAADEAGDVALVRWSERWLSTRMRLAKEAAIELAGLGRASAVARPV